MPKYINADEYIKYCEENWIVLNVDAVNEQPAADVAPVKHGYFIGTEFDGYADGNPVYYEWECSECGCVFEDDEPHYKFCPYCGAKMDREAEDDGRDL